MADPINPWSAGGLVVVVLAVIKVLDGLVRRLMRRLPPVQRERAYRMHEDVEDPLRDTMMREFGVIARRLDSIETEIKLNRDRYHDLAGVLSTVATEVKLLIAGRIKLPREPHHADSQ